MNQGEAIRYALSEVVRNTERLALAKVFDTRLFPSKVIDSEGEVNRLARLIEADYSLICVFTHPTKRDPLAVLGTMLRLYPRLRPKHVIAPIGQSEYELLGGKRGVGKVANWHNIDLIPITTPLTKEAEARYIKKGKRIPWTQYPIGYGNHRYLRASLRAMKRKDIVLVAPQGKRDSSLNRFDSAPLQKLVTLSKPTDKPVVVDKLAFALWGIELPSRLSYARESVGGFNPRETYHLRMQVRTREELEEESQTTSQSIDDIAHSILNTLVSPYYLAK